MPPFWKKYKGIRRLHFDLPDKPSAVRANSRQYEKQRPEQGRLFYVRINLCSFKQCKQTSCQWHFVCTHLFYQSLFSKLMLPNLFSNFSKYSHNKRATGRLQNVQNNCLHSVTFPAFHPASVMKNFVFLSFLLPYYSMVFSSHSLSKFAPNSLNLVQI